MEFLKHKAGILALVVCLLIILSVIWYLMFGTGGDAVMEGTLVRGIKLCPKFYI
ncbi:MAG: hypothetical protein KH366_22920 [Clostridiaceae bacterium]|nr:hypothetical protein [Clostridiaceae bacterium]